MDCISCDSKSGNYETQLGLCNDCQWCIYDHIKQHSVSGCQQKNYDILDSIKKEIAKDTKGCQGDLYNYLSNNSSVFNRFERAITFHIENGYRYLDWARTLAKLGVRLDIETTKHF